MTTRNYCEYNECSALSQVSKDEKAHEKRDLHTSTFLFCGLKGDGAREVRRFKSSVLDSTRSHLPLTRPSDQQHAFAHTQSRMAQSRHRQSSFRFEIELAVVLLQAIESMTEDVWTCRPVKYFEATGMADREGE